MYCPSPEIAKCDSFSLNSILKNNFRGYESYCPSLAIYTLLPANSIRAFPDQKLALRQDLLKFGRCDVTFSVTTIMKLPQPYKPYCHLYKSTDNTKSYCDCVIQCSHRQMFEMLNCTFAQLDTLKKCVYESCLPNCIQEIFSYDIKDVTDSPSFINEKPNRDTIIIKILPKDTDEFTYIHQPKISRNDFSKFDGLLSLWLGFSFFLIYSYIEQCIKKYIAKKVR